MWGTYRGESPGFEGQTADAMMLVSTFVAILLTFGAHGAGQHVTDGKKGVGLIGIHDIVGVVDALDDRLAGDVAGCVVAAVHLDHRAAAPREGDVAQQCPAGLIAAVGFSRSSNRSV